VTRKTAFVTGTSSGIGAAVGRRLIALGYDVAGFDRQPGSGDTCTVHYDGDITDMTSVNAAVDDFTGKFGDIDLVVPCAAIVLRGLLADIGRRETSIGNVLPVLGKADSEHLLDINVRGSFNVCRATIPHIKDDGSIVLFGSIVPARPAIGMTAYSASKGAMDGLMTSLAVELSPRIRVNAVAPYVVETNIWLASGMSEEDWEKMKGRVAQNTLLLRNGKPEDVANAVCFLASEEASWITGVMLPVTGGMHLK
jgi:NAD(P)-dependent dehydrogenase (short-subunit alcohol dehydrogenase family)